MLYKFQDNFQDNFHDNFRDNFQDNFFLRNRAPEETCFDFCLGGTPCSMAEFVEREFPRLRMEADKVTKCLLLEPDSEGKNYHKNYHENHHENYHENNHEISKAY